MSGERSEISAERSAPRGGVFLSYASQDAEAAKRICEALRAAGVEVWFDQSELVGGDAWDQKIRKQIRECALLIPVISKTTQGRREAYFRLEWKLADERTHLMAKGTPFLLPITIDETSDREALVPDSFLAVQWTRLPGGDGATAFATRVKKLLGGEVAPVSDWRSVPAAETDVGHRPAPPQNRKRWLVPAIAGAVVALLALVISRPWEKTSHAAAPAQVATADAPVSPARQLVAKVWEQLNKPGLSRIELEVANDLAGRAAVLDATDAEVIAAGAQVDTWFEYHGFDATPERQEQARRKAARALQLSPRNFEARLAQTCYLVRGGGELSAERAGQAETQLRALLREIPGEPRALEALGTLQDRTGAGVAARATFEQLTHNPAFAAQAWNEIGWSATSAGDFKVAESAADRSIAIQPYWSNLSLRAWLAISWRGDPEQARAAIDRIPAAVMQEDFVISMVTWVHWYRRDGPAILRMLKGVPRDWLSSTMMDGPMAAYAAFGHQLAGQKEAARAQWSAALQAVERRLAIAPNSTNLLYWKGLILLELGQRDEADQVLNLGVELAGAPLQGYGLAIVEALRGKGDEAITALEVAADRRENNVMPALLRRDPHCDALREMPRFKALLARLDADPRFATDEPPTSERLETKK